MAGRGAWRQWRHRRLPRFCSDAVPHRLAMRRRFLATVPVGAALETPAASNLRAPTRPSARPRGDRKDALDTRRITTVSSTRGGFHRRRRRRRLLLLGRHAVGRGTTFGADCAAQRAASAPSPPHVHSTRAHSEPSCCGHELARAWESERSSSVARARQGAWRKVRAGRWRMERWLGAAPSSDAPGAGRSRAGGSRVRAVAKKR